MVIVDPRPFRPVTSEGSKAVSEKVVPSLEVEDARQEFAVPPDIVQRRRRSGSISGAEDTVRECRSGQESAPICLSAAIF